MATHPQTRDFPTNWRPALNQRADHPPIYKASSNGDVMTEDIQQIQPWVSPPYGSGNPTKRLDWWSRTIILASFIILAAGVGFLSWLWFEDRENVQWRRLMLGPYSTQAITISGIIIRTAIAALATFSVSMLASIGLEGHGVPIDAMAEVSMARFSNGGPISLFSYFLSGEVFSFVPRFLGAMLLLFALASQFTSTLLVSDLEPVYLSSFNKTIGNGYNFKLGPSDTNKTTTPQPLIGFSYNYFLSKPSSSEIFAEYSSPGQLGANFEDTGPSVRAFIPRALQAERESLRTFQGMARTLDTRVVCIQPEITLNFCFQESASYNLFICGEISADLSNLPPDLDIRNYTDKSNQTRISSPFQCSIIDSSVSDTVDTWALCRTGFGLASMLNNGTQTAGKEMVDKSWIFWDVGAIMIDSEDQGISETLFKVNTTWTTLNSTRSGPWLDRWSHISTEDGSMKADYHLKISWCFYSIATMGIGNLNITASSAHNLTEPSYQWNAEANAYDTSSVRNQLGAFNYSNTDASTRPDREILHISPEDMEVALAEVRGQPETTPYVDDLGFAGWLFNFVTLPNGKDVAICTVCSPDIIYFQTVDSLLKNLFVDVLTSTNSPALTLQAFNTVLFRNIYYDFISAFSPTSNATVSRYDLTLAPRNTLGFTAVMVIIAINMTLFLGIFTIFYRQTEFSLIANAWQTIAQVSQNPNMRRYLEDARFKRDNEIKDIARGQTPSKGFLKETSKLFRDSFRQKLSNRVEKYVLDDFVMQTTSVQPQIGRARTRK